MARHRKKRLQHTLMSTINLTRLNDAQKKEIFSFETYLYEKEFSENSIASYSNAVAQFFYWGYSIDKINLVNYKKQLIQNYKLETTNLRIAAINNFLIFKKKESLQLKSLKRGRKAFTDNIISEKEYAKLCVFLKERKENYYFLVRFLAGTGARVSELVQFTVQDLKRGYLDLFTKGRHRRIRIPKKLIEEAMPYYANHKKYLFLSKYGTPLTSRGVTRILKDYAIKSGVNPDVVFPHSFRHFFAKQFLKKHKNIQLLSDFLGHADIKTTAIYLQMSNKEQSKSFNQIVDW